MRDQILGVLVPVLGKMLAEYGAEISTSQIDLPRPPDPAMGDYALNLPLKLAKIMRKPPIKIAQQIAEMLQECEIFSKVDVAPPGYVNLTLANRPIEEALVEISHDIDGSLRRGGKQETVVVDYSGVNIAKQMHVGHLRSTIIGDVIARVMEARGVNVIRQNHLGDWGLPIAMVLWKAQPVIREVESRGGDLYKELTLARLEELYREATVACKEDSAASEACHQILVELQNGNEQLLSDWQQVTRLSMGEVYRVYDFMGVSLKAEHERGESFYRDFLAATVDSIESTGLLVESDGAGCVFLEKFKGKDGKPLPVIVRKSDGGFNYETFDLAAIRYRIETLGAKRVIYVTDSRQSLHFAQVFSVAEACGWTGDSVHLEHVAFGSVLGEDNKPLKTRSGENVKLVDLLNEAVDRSYAVVNEKNPGLSDERKREVAQAVGIGAVKYADLSHDRINDYVFAWDRMLALNGNTGPYLQYAHARICSIFRKGNVSEAEITGPAVLNHAAERELAFKIMEFSDTVASVEADLRPHVLCTYLYELATAFSAFYDQCSVLNAESAEMKQSRLFLCHITRQILAKGLDLLGIQAPREM